VVPEKNNVEEDRRLNWDGYDVWDYNS